MIKLQDLTPEVYYEYSRDFQFIGRLYDIVLNATKTNTDLLNNLRGGLEINDDWTSLLSTTFGFKARHSYNAIQLRAICSVLPLIMRQKGSMQAITTAVNALLYAEGVTQALDYSLTNNNLTLYLPEDLSDLSLLYDLMPYILPAGISCNFVKELSAVHEIETVVSITDTISATITDGTDMNEAMAGPDNIITAPIAGYGQNWISKPNILYSMSGIITPTELKGQQAEPGIQNGNTVNSSITQPKEIR